jgi:hypothetical protein
MVRVGMRHDYRLRGAELAEVPQPVLTAIEKNGAAAVLEQQRAVAPMLG